MVKTLQFSAATFVTMNFNCKERYGLHKLTPSQICWENRCRLCVKKLQFFFESMNFKSKVVYLLRLYVCFAKSA